VTIKNAASYPLYVYSSGVGSVPISSSTGQAGTTSYSSTVNQGVTVNLTAPATWDGMTFSHWSGSVSSSNQTITLNIDAMKYVIAYYEYSTTPTPYSLDVKSSGASSVAISSSTGHGGTTNYMRTVNDSTNVTLTAPMTAGGKTFTGWTGSVSNSNRTISLSMNANKTVTANYSGVTTPTTYTLSVYSRGATGVPISSSTGHGGTTNYAKTVNEGTTVTLTAPATSGGTTFTNWAGSVTSSSRTISLSMNAAKTVTANYEADTGCVSSTASVESIVPGKKKGSRGRSFGSVTVTLVDNCGNSVVNAEVVGTFTGDYNERVVATTNAQGVVTFKTATQVKKPSYRFCIDDIVKGGLVYSASDVVPTCVSY